MNILHFAEYKSPYKGNFISSLENLSSYLEDNNNKLFYLFPDQTKDRNWTSELNNVYFLKRGFFENIKCIKKIIKDNDIDIIHIHFYNLKILTIFKLLFPSKKIIVHLHGMFVNSKGIKKVIEKLLFKGVNIISCSEAVLKSFKYSNIVNNQKCIKNCIYFERLKLENEMLNLSNNSNDSLKILFFAYNYYIKGVDIVLKALKEMHNKRNIQCFVSISSNKDIFIKKVEEIFDEIPEWITILEPINEIGCYYRMVDVFISASRSEGFCYALVEAAFCGCQLIASNIPAQKELLIDNVKWFESENYEQLANILLKIKKEKKKINISALEKNYDLDNWSKEIIKFYNDISGDVNEK